MLGNNLNLGVRYDIAVDSLKWSEISLSGGTQLFKQNES